MAINKFVETILTNYELTVVSHALQFSGS